MRLWSLSPHLTVRLPTALSSCLISQAACPTACLLTFSLSRPFSPVFCDVSGVDFSEVSPSFFFFLARRPSPRPPFWPSPSQLRPLAAYT
ncbi:hypothetical protein BDZ88DRAFT_420716 [Geranomyces variabilis]|nr:hypothetical protein BDZ88DRAFT_420716 [Geranomyces variabilis]